MHIFGGHMLALLLAKLEGCCVIPLDKISSIVKFDIWGKRTRQKSYTSPSPKQALHHNSCWSRGYISFKKAAHWLSNFSNNQPLMNWLCFPQVQWQKPTSCTKIMLGGLNHFSHVCYWKHNLLQQHQCPGHKAKHVPKLCPKRNAVSKES